MEAFRNCLYNSHEKAIVTAETAAGPGNQPFLVASVVVQSARPALPVKRLVNDRVAVLERDPNMHGRKPASRWVIPSSTGSACPDLAE